MVVPLSLPLLVVAVLLSCFFFLWRESKKWRCWFGVLTVIPLSRQNGQVLVVGGKHRGERGKMMQKSKKSQTTAVQLHDTLEIVKVDFDDVAEFCSHDE